MEGREGLWGLGGEDGKTDSILSPPGPAPSTLCASLSPARVPCLPCECGQGDMPALSWDAEGQVGPTPAWGTQGVWASTVSDALFSHPFL